MPESDLWEMTTWVTGKDRSQAVKLSVMVRAEPLGDVKAAARSEVCAIFRRRYAEWPDDTYGQTVQRR